jgi:hypothetical protein
VRYSGWYPRRRGILQHLDEGRISLLDLAVHDFLCLLADHKTGVAWASSEKIHALCPAEINSRAIRRSLAKMEALGWLKRFCVRGRRGNYPILIARYFVRDVSGNWLSVNVARTTDLRNIQFDPVRDQSFLVSRADREDVHEPVGELSGIQEGRNEKSDLTEGRVNLTGDRVALPAKTCCLNVSDPWVFSGLDRKLIGKQFLHDGFEQDLQRSFTAYVGYSHDEGQCTCSPADFLNELMAYFEDQGKAWPPGVLVRKKELVDRGI